MMTILLSVLFLAVVGFASGILLGYAYIKFEVKIDPRIVKIEEILPGVNCGACGFPGCRGFAEAIVAGKAAPEKCLIGRKSNVPEKIAQILSEEHAAT